jgi:hypothetical protein
MNVTEEVWAPSGLARSWELEKNSQQNRALPSQSDSFMEETKKQPSLEQNSSHWPIPLILIPHSPSNFLFRIHLLSGLPARRRKWQSFPHLFSHICQVIRDTESAPMRWNLSGCAELHQVPDPEAHIPEATPLLYLHLTLQSSESIVQSQGSRWS